MVQESSGCFSCFCMHVCQHSGYTKPLKNRCLLVFLTVPLLLDNKDHNSSMVTHQTPWMMSSTQQMLWGVTTVGGHSVSASKDWPSTASPHQRTQGQCSNPLLYHHKHASNIHGYESGFHLLHGGIILCLVLTPHQWPPFSNVLQSCHLLTDQAITTKECRKMSPH